MDKKYLVSYNTGNEWKNIDDFHYIGQAQMCATDYAKTLETMCVVTSIESGEVILEADENGKVMVY